MANIRDERMATELGHRLEVIEGMMPNLDVAPLTILRHLAKAISFINTGIEDSENPRRDSMFIQDLTMLQIQISKGEEEEAEKGLFQLRSKIASM